MRGWGNGPVHSLCRLEASAILWRIHVRKPSTNVLTPLKLGALRVVARDNIFEMAHKLTLSLPTISANTGDKICS